MRSWRGVISCHSCKSLQAMNAEQIGNGRAWTPAGFICIIEELLHCPHKDTVWVCSLIKHFLQQACMLSPCILTWMPASELTDAWHVSRAKGKIDWWPARQDQ